MVQSQVQDVEIVKFQRFPKASVLGDLKLGVKYPKDTVTVLKPFNTLTVAN